MTTALICLRGYRVTSVLDAARQILAPEMAWVVLHVVDIRPLQEVDRALGGLPVHGPGHHRAEDRLHRAAAEEEAAIQVEVETWLRAHDRVAELVIAYGHPDQEILRICQERAVDLIALGSGYPGLGPPPISPPVRFLIDHVRCDILLLRRYAAST
jgi:nucleotide-binding universal stress UspA family protein